ncbi:cytochrome P450 [Blastococcus sp. URHD0036]|uniref:cytochrome P450 n=1 Tax=Blastococcus sp. URHD0036 TaxID=1380356 RepID=UPI000497A251|nr:cytochrome P450 [Blastococcus sp. URHD0036]
MTDADRTAGKRYLFDRHTPDYRLRFDAVRREMQERCPIAWTDTYGGHWVASGNREVFELVRSSEYLSSDHDVHGERGGPRYQGITIPSGGSMRAVFQEMDPPEQRYYRNVLNPYLSPAAVERWRPFVVELTHAALDERIESGRIDFVDDLANIVPAVFTLAMMGLPLADWTVYCEPTHAVVYTPPDSPDMARVMEQNAEVFGRLYAAVQDVRADPRPGLVDALVRATIGGEVPPDTDLAMVLMLLIGGGFDTTTALTAHSLEWLAENPGERARLAREQDTLLDPATEEFLRFFTPAPGIARTFRADCTVMGTDFREGDRLWLSWAMSNRDPAVFPEPDRVDLDRTGNRHTSFGLGIHRCIGSNVARMAFKTMLTAVLERMPDYSCDPAEAVHYDTVGVINGMKHLPATFSPGPRRGPGLDATLAALQRVCDEQRLAEPVRPRPAPASA